MYFRFSGPVYSWRLSWTAVAFMPSCFTPEMDEQICATPGGAALFRGNPEPIELKTEDRTKANTVYDEWGLSIDAYEQSVQVSTFTSKFDASLKGNYTMTPDEMAGFQLFNGKGNCNSCHVDGRGTTLQPGQVGHQHNRDGEPSSIHLLRLGQ
jgi:cytochrome c peroxidase